MIRHVVLFRFREDAADADRQAVLAELPSAIEQIRRYEYGDDVGLVEGNFDFAVVADFDDRSAFETYAAHPRHQQLITDRIRPILTERVAVQYQLDD